MLLQEYATEAEARGLQVIIAGAGAAHLPGMTAAHTMLPVLGVPVQSHALQGLDSLLSIVQMPGGVPVATLAIGKAGAINAASLAVSILGNSRPELRAKLKTFRDEQTSRVLKETCPSARGFVVSRSLSRGKPILPGSTACSAAASSDGCSPSPPDGWLPRSHALARRRHAHRASGRPRSASGLRRPRRRARFARHVDVVTFEFENVSSAATNAAEEFAPVRPAGSVLHTTQHRLREKTFRTANGFPVTPNEPPRSLAELEAALVRLGTPAVLKTAGWGYDGKGQSRSQPEAMPRRRGDKVATNEAILEAWAPFKSEVSVAPAAGAVSIREYADFGVVANSHRNQILEIPTVAPADVSDRVRRDATEIARAILERLQVVGVLCVEFSPTHDDKLLVNELAPCPHNSRSFV